jgi:peptidoglycan pentaglycine glycine transferase (the first glycine)
MIRYAKPDEVAQWDKLIAGNPDGGHIYQSYEWSQFKKQNNWEPQYVVYEEPGVVIYFTLIRKSAGLLGTIYYCSKGPGIFTNFKTSHDATAHFTELCTQLPHFIGRYDKRAILVKLEPELEAGELDLKKLGLVKSKGDLQFKATIFVDLSPSEEDILAGLKQKTRYNIRLAERKGVKVESRAMDADGVDLMYSLMTATQERAKFFLRKKDYFAGYWQALYKAKMGELLVATYNDEVLAGVFVTVFGTKSYYKDGGSFPIQRNLMAPYLLQWRAMQWAKAHGATSYDMVAVPPRDQLDNPDHSQHGLYLFKRGFNEEVTEFVGCCDLPIDTRKFRIWKRQESYYLRLYAKLKNNLFW